MFDLLQDASLPQAANTWPPYDIERSAEDAYRVTIAVAGFAKDELEITHQPNLLVVSGERKQPEQGEYLHRGLAIESFTRRFQLADHVKVASASLTNGLLAVELVREVPEEMKPRRIDIGSSSAPAAQGQIEAKAA
jgi:molecular chaperone IbpA